MKTAEPSSVSPSRDSLFSELQMMWDEIGENEAESNVVLLEKEDLQICQEKVAKTREYLATLRQSLSDAEAEINSIVSAMHEPVPFSQPQGRDTLKNRISAIKPVLEDLRLRKGERVKELLEIQSQIGRLLAEIAGNNHSNNYADPLVDEHDLSMNRLAALKTCLNELEGAKALRLQNLASHLSTIHELSAVMSIDLSNDMKLERYSNSISDDALAGLKDLIYSLTEEKRQRLEKLQDLGRKLVELWNLMCTPTDQQKQFDHVTSIISSSVNLSRHGCLSKEVLEQTEIEVKRLNSLKPVKMKELVLKKHTELEGLYRDTCLHVHSDTQKKLIDLIDSGNVDLCKLLAKMDAQIVEAKEAASSRKDILDKVRKWQSACKKERWLNKYEQVHIMGILLWLDKYEQKTNQDNAGKEAAKNIEQAEKAQILVRKMPSMVKSLIADVKAWERERSPFLFGKYSLKNKLKAWEARNYFREDVKKSKEKEEEETSMPHQSEKRDTGRPSPAGEIWRHGHAIYVHLPLSTDGVDMHFTRIASSEPGSYQELAALLHNEHIRACGWKQDSGVDVNILYPWPNHKAIYEGSNVVLDPLKLSWDNFVSQVRSVSFQKRKIEEERMVQIIIQRKKKFERVSYLRFTEEVNSFPIFFRALYFQFAAITNEVPEDRFNSKLWRRGSYLYYFVSGKSTRLIPPIEYWVMSEDGSGIEVDLVRSDSDTQHLSTLDSDSDSGALDATPEVEHESKDSTSVLDDIFKGYGGGPSDDESGNESSDFDSSIFSLRPVDSWTEFIESLDRIIFVDP